MLWQGTSTGSVTFSDAEGSPTHVDVNNKFLALSTSAGVLKIYDVSRAQPKLVRFAVFCTAVCMASVPFSVCMRVANVVRVVCVVTDELRQV